MSSAEGAAPPTYLPLIAKAEESSWPERERITQTLSLTERDADSPRMAASGRDGTVARSSRWSCGDDKLISASGVLKLLTRPRPVMKELPYCMLMPDASRPLFLKISEPLRLLTGLNVSPGLKAKDCRATVPLYSMALNSSGLPLPLTWAWSLPRGWYERQRERMGSASLSRNWLVWTSNARRGLTP